MPAAAACCRLCSSALLDSKEIFFLALRHIDTVVSTFGLALEHRGVVWPVAGGHLLAATTGVGGGECLWNVSAQERTTSHTDAYSAATEMRGQLVLLHLNAE